MKRFLCVCLLTCSLASAVSAQGTSQHRWPQYRGPDGNGQATGSTLPAKIDQRGVVWKTAIHGKGWSSPVVWDNQVWLTTARKDGKTMSAVCADLKTGKIIHDIVVCENEEPAFCHAMNSYATPTPVVEEGRVYVHFGAYLTACLDSKTGEVLWQRRDFECDHYRGPASSPIVHDGRLYVAYDGYDLQYVVALDKNTGKTVWRTERDIDYGTNNGDRMKAYCTAHVINVSDNDQLIYPSAVATIAYEPKSGKELWKVYHGGMNASARPLYHDGVLFLTNGMGRMAAVKADGKGDVTDTHVIWDAKKSVAKKSSPLIVDDLLYMITDDGIATCRDPKSGDIHWQERLGGAYAASPTFADGKIYFFSIEGAVTTIKPGKEYSVLAETTLGDGFMASAAIVDGAMILRSKSHLYRVQ